MLLENKSRDLYESNERLKKVGEQNRMILETVADAIVTFDAEGVILSFNPAARRIFRCECRIGHKITDLVDRRKDQTKVLFPSQSSQRSKADPNCLQFEPHEIDALRSDGTLFCAEVTITVCEDAGKITYTALIRDQSNRKKLELRLRQAQKMESVGQLAAGIAHEINTPIQFVGDNIRFLQGAFDDFNGLIELFDELTARLVDGNATGELLKRIDQQRQQVDIDFLREEFPDAIGQSLGGIERIAKIVRALKEFSQPHSESKTTIDLNRAIENTLAILANQISQVGQVSTRLDPKIPFVPCLAAQMNQVWLNLLSNALDAIGENHPDGDGLIQIQTLSVGDEVEIRIQDNGPGIPASIQDRIFEPFFTTKEVGKGSGQGLSFVYDVVVQKHDGSVHVQSPVEGGATVVIRLPAIIASFQGRPDHVDAVR
ncbi:PAS domain-containing sensor histidine kinase [Neorhodopirellula pilleata]|nr:ATP-binding protein [Neorhodopirellula pilleata]